ncbi:biogenesis of lysosome-related organelles complex 1 subunit 1 [Beta vulgaris subsp. vulgaris]|uniref:biogenesis of lysosome-related organelles complex 1 subunit 1 n=1 Tax=Beta vulgaris subsp. vulgaris TaxID=3555 RepID=UPI00053FF141|nr:biogenesis of lysosome-related organelles complex 1 subunit 1 [Beta vulgaris subsp. vulgaris]
MSISVQHPPLTHEPATSTEGMTTTLESSLLNLLHQHQVSSSSLRNQTEKSKKEAIKAGIRVSELMVDAVNGGVQESFLHQKQIELEIRSLTVTINRFHKQTQQWLNASRSLNTAIKEIGDFENWIKVMEYDCKSITTAIRNIHQA